MTSLELLANAVRFLGLLLALPGLWFSAGGMRVVVSGRIDERKRSAASLRRGLPLLVIGLLLLFGGSWLANWALMYCVEHKHDKPAVQYMEKLANTADAAVKGEPCRVEEDAVKAVAQGSLFRD